MVEILAQSTLRRVGAAARDLDVDALGVVLGAVLVVGRVQGNDLVAQDVVAGGDAAGDGDGPAVVVGDEVVRRPGARRARVVDQALLVDLEELQRRLVDRRAVAVARRQVRDDGSVVAVRPWRPLQLDGAAGGHGGCQRCGRRIPVADDVRALVSCAVDEAQVGGGRGPADDGGWVGFVGERVDDVPAVAVGSQQGVKQAVQQSIDRTAREGVTIGHR